MTMFRVPVSFAMFADLDNDRAMLLEEYGIPAYTGRFDYPLWAKRNVLHRVWSTGAALAGGVDPDTAREAGRVLAWVRRNGCTCGRPKELVHLNGCDLHTIMAWNYAEEAPPQ